MKAKSAVCVCGGVARLTFEGRETGPWTPLSSSPMSEYWVSNKKYYCKYCEIYIADDAPSRQHHENGLRHKGNRDRFVRGLYKQGEKRKKDLEEEKREIARVEQVRIMHNMNQEQTVFER